MTIQEIYNNTVIRDLEIEILRLQMNQERHGYTDDAARDTISILLKVRKNLLDDFFVLNTETQQLLGEFNDSLSDAVLKAAFEAERVYASSIRQINEHVEIKSKCFLGYSYPKLHPIKTNRSKKIWALLSGVVDEYDPMYYDGVIIGGYEAEGIIDVYTDKNKNLILYAEETPDNWNEGLDRDMTKDMHLTRQFHHLFEHSLFSLYDLLWVREFTIETTAEYIMSINNSEDDIDWSKPDFYND